MGRMLGYFDNGDELDRPDLNKCPDCGCFFAQENISVCRDVTSDKFYRSAEDLKGEFVSVTLSIVEKITDMKGYYNGEKYVSYYICSVDGAGYEIMVRDCIQDNEQNFIAGDIVTFYGEGAGNVTVYDMNGKTYILPCLNAAYTSYSP